MKYLNKILLICTLLFSSTFCYAELLTFNTTHFSMRQKVGYYWSSWEDWQKSDMLVTIDIDKEKIIIFSPKRQIYNIYDYTPAHTDSDGDEVVNFEAIDQDGDICKINLMYRKSGSLELYILFADVQWVYRIISK